MSKCGRRVTRGSGLILVFTTVVLAACASAAPGEPGVAGQRPRDDANTRAASVSLVQASLASGEEARRHYEEALFAATDAIERDPSNPRAYLIAGQAAVGVEDWVMADTMFARAEVLYPGYAEQVEAEREEGWVVAYNLGAEAMTAGDMAAAVARFRGADRLYQGRPEARLALGIVYLREGNMSAAIEAYQGALEILAAAPPEAVAPEQLEAWERDRQVATFQLANLLSEAGRYADAADVLGRFLEESPATVDQTVRLQAMTARAAFLGQAGRAAEAAAVYEDLLGRAELGAGDYLQIGIGLYNADEFERATEAFATAARLNPYSRDAHLNLVQALYSKAAGLEQEPETPARNQRLHEAYDGLLESAQRVQELDPLNRNLLSFVLRTYRAKADISPRAEADRLMQRSQDVFRQYQAMEYEVSELSVTGDADDEARIEGRLTNIAGRPGSQASLQFSVLDMNGNVMDTATVEVTVPAVEESVRFSTTVDLSRGEYAGWRYQLR
jgi:tetratricopeptide (TPR) repeat protein